MPERRIVRAIAAGLLGTLALGLWLRWFLAGVGVALPSGAAFAHLRHAHSHLGYYAVLLPLAWMAWRAEGGDALRAREGWLYALATVVATIGFAMAGYGLLGIVGSTIVGALWLVAGVRVARGTRGSDDPMVAVLPGTVLALSCIPIIATSLRSDPPLAAAAVQSFLSALLFLVVAPAALTALGLRQRWAWGTVVTGAGAAFALGLWPSVWTRIALGVHALTWLVAARRLPQVHHGVVWGAAALGLLLVAVGAVPLVHDSAIAAVHFLVLGPLLSALVARNLAAGLPSWAWWLYHGAVALLAAPLAWRALWGGGWTGLASAVGGTAVVLWWGAVLGRRLGVGIFRR